MPEEGHFVAGGEQETSGPKEKGVEQVGTIAAVEHAEDVEGGGEILTSEDPQQEQDEGHR